MARRSRRTRQKEVLDKAVKKQGGFFTAQAIADSVKEESFEIGIATIYRYLAAARKSGKLHAYLCEGRQIYSVKQRNHCHFTCEVCKSTTHVRIDNLTYLNGQIQGSICHVQVDITGICNKCEQSASKS